MTTESIKERTRIIENRLKVKILGRLANFCKLGLISDPNMIFHYHHHKQHHHQQQQTITTPKQTNRNGLIAHEGPDNSNFTIVKCCLYFVTSYSNLICNNENTPIQIYWKFHLQNTENFQTKTLDTDHISA